MAYSPSWLARVLPCIRAETSISVSRTALLWKLRTVSVLPGWLVVQAIGDALLPGPHCAWGLCQLLQALLGDGKGKCSLLCRGRFGNLHAAGQLSESPEAHAECIAAEARTLTKRTSCLVSSTRRRFTA